MFMYSMFYMLVIIKISCVLDHSALAVVLAQTSYTQDKATLDQNDTDEDTYEETCFEDKVWNQILMCILFYHDKPYLIYP